MKTSKAAAVIVDLNVWLMKETEGHSKVGLMIGDVADHEREVRVSAPPIE